jgi:multicomponent K+:H+ antiporter subunit F
MLNTVLTVAPWIFGVALTLNVWRMLRGPDATDRILALDTLYINATAALVLYGLEIRNTHFFEAALIIALLGFVGTASLAKYLLRGDIIE